MNHARPQGSGPFSFLLGHHLDRFRPDQSSAEALIDAASIDTGDATRDAHLRSADLLDVKNYPEIRFKSTSVRPMGDSWQVDGDLTIKDATPVMLTVEYTGTADDPWGNTRAGSEASTGINRGEWGVTWLPVLEPAVSWSARKSRSNWTFEAVLQKPGPA